MEKDMITVNQAMQKLATPSAKREYAATADKYLFAKDTLVSFLDDEIAPMVTGGMVNAFEEMLAAK
jgi:hypothetical protein